MTAGIKLRDDALDHEITAVVDDGRVPLDKVVAEAPARRVCIRKARRTHNKEQVHGRDDVRTQLREYGVAARLECAVRRRKEETSALELDVALHDIWDGSRVESLEEFGGWHEEDVLTIVSHVRWGHAHVRPGVGAHDKVRARVHDQRHPGHDLNPYL